MAVLNSTSLQIPAQMAQGIIDNVQTGSAVAALSGQKPQRFGATNIVTFNKHPRAEFVEEGAQKSPAEAVYDTAKATPHKAQVTVRFNQEVMWADEDTQLGVLQSLSDAAQVALARALDLGVFHRLNPLSGDAMSSWTNYLTSTSKVVTASGDVDKDIESLIGKVLAGEEDGPDVNGIAFSKSEAFALATAKDKQGRLLHPELGYGTTMTAFNGLPAYVSTTVNAPEAKTKTNIAAIAGDFANGVYWGVQKDLPVELIEFGDPDGLGDLKRNNQLALRLEILYAWYVFPERFAVVKGAAATPAHQ